MNQEANTTPTSALWQRLFKAPSARSYLEANGDALDLRTFSEYITALCRKKGEVPERIIKRAGIERAFGHQLFRGARNPSRDTVIMLAFGFEANVETAQSLLRHAGHSQLYPRIRRDATIAYALDHGYTLPEAQQMLFELALPIVGRSIT